MGPDLSIVIPTLNEARSLPLLLSDLRPLAGRLRVEIVVADGGSDDGTVALAREHAAVVAPAQAGRGTQLRAGVAAATAPLLWVLHADARVPPETLDAVVRHAASGVRSPRAFRLGIASSRMSLRVIAWGANLRSRFLALPYGDQSLLIDRAVLEAAGGYPETPLMEDVELALRLRRHDRIRLLPERVLVSPRRWERDGPWRRSLRNVVLLLRYLAGADPRALARRYRASSTDSPTP